MFKWFRSLLRTNPHNGRVHFAAPGDTQDAHGIAYVVIDDPRYKYKLTRDYVTRVNMATKFVTCNDSMSPFIDLRSDGTLTIYSGYCWDGPSGPTWDRQSLMRGSLAHDALYQLCRMRVLNWVVDQMPADILFGKMCREDGLNRASAYAAPRFLKTFGTSSAQPRDGIV